MAVRPDQHRTIGVDPVGIVPVAAGVAEISVMADREGGQWRPRWSDLVRGLTPRVAVAAGNDGGGLPRTDAQHRHGEVGHADTLADQLRAKLRREILRLPAILSG